MHLQQVIVVVVEEGEKEEEEDPGVRAVHVPVPGQVPVPETKHGRNIALLVGAACFLALVYKMYGFF